MTMEEVDKIVGRSNPNQRVIAGRIEVEYYELNDSGNSAMPLALLFDSKMRLVEGWYAEIYYPLGMLIEDDAGADGPDDSIDARYIGMVYSDFNLISSNAADKIEVGMTKVEVDELIGFVASYSDHTAEYDRIDRVDEENGIIIIQPVVVLYDDDLTAIYVHRTERTETITIEYVEQNSKYYPIILDCDIRKYEFDP